MNVHYCIDYEEMSQLACNLIVADINKNPKQLLCVATGNSPLLLYKKIANYYKPNLGVLKELSVIKLDEWGGINANDESSCETYIRNQIIVPLQISEADFISFKSNPESPVKECERIQNELESKGPIDVCILGLGKNGHIGFNEPSNELTSHCHMAQLSQSSLEHSMVNKLRDKPMYGLTLGIKNILRSKKIVLLVTGSGKKKIVQELLTQNISPNVPASYLWKHHNVECYIDVNYS